ncbi:DUF4258 domain-containing protein [Candidatus Woesearchaeota archaeon]|nr:DUF4258 domain-containing protein [Candidatus Woesearchaeota archaeon]
MNGLEKIKKFLEEIKDEDVIFKLHFYERTADRPISEELVRRSIKNTTNLLKAEEQPARRFEENKYKLWIKLSNKYCLVLVIVIKGKTLYIITGWNSDTKWLKK